MKKTPAKAAPKKLDLKKKTVVVLSDKSIIANLNNTKRPIVIISLGCATDFTKYLPTDYRKLLATDFTKPA